MDFSIKYNLPFKAKFSRKDLSCTIYIPFRKWLFGMGGWGKSKWITILGLTFSVMYWKLWTVSLSATIQ